MENIESETYRNFDTIVTLRREVDEMPENAQFTVRLLIKWNDESPDLLQDLETWGQVLSRNQQMVVTSHFSVSDAIEYMKEILSIKIKTDKEDAINEAQRIANKIGSSNFKAFRAMCAKVIKNIQSAKESDIAFEPL